MTIWPWGRRVAEDLIALGLSAGPLPAELAPPPGRDRFFTIDPPSVELLRGYREWQRDLSVAADSLLVGDPYVLSDNANAGRPVRPSKITDRFTTLRGKAKVRGVTFHGLRHAAISQQLGAGIDPVTVAARSGWASTRTLLSTYAHALPAGDVRAASVMGALLPG